MGKNESRKEKTSADLERIAAQAIQVRANNSKFLLLY